MRDVAKLTLDGNHGAIATAYAGNIEIILCDGSDGNLRIFSGLCDRFGKDIYTGDVVGESSSGKMYLVEFDYGRFTIRNASRPPVWLHGISLTVVGNIYANPELLSEVQP